MIVAFPKPGDECYDEIQELMRKAPRVSRSNRNAGKIKMNIGYHAPVAHMLNRPCIYFGAKPKWRRYPLVHERNVIPILVHESIHCAMQRILDYDKESQLGFDRMFPMVGDL